MITDIALGILMAIAIIFFIGIAMEYAKELLKLILFLLKFILFSTFIYVIYVENTEAIELAFVLTLFLSPAIYFIYKNYYAGLWLGKLAKNIKSHLKNQ